MIASAKQDSHEEGQPPVGQNRKREPQARQESKVAEKSSSRRNSLDIDRTGENSKGSNKGSQGKGKARLAKYGVDHSKILKTTWSRVHRPRSCLVSVWQRTLFWLGLGP